MELSNRLYAIAKMVSKHSKVADIGCDHGYLSIYLEKEKQCERVIAMDVNHGPLDRAQKNIQRYGLDQTIQTRLSDGAKALHANEVNTLICAGMGGLLMKKILADVDLNYLGIEQLILQPQSQAQILRLFLREIGFAIIDEDALFEDHKYYQIIHARRMNTIINDGSHLDDYFGPVLLQTKNPVLLTYLHQELAKIEAIALRMQQDGIPMSDQEIAQKQSRITNALEFMQRDRNEM